MGEETIRTLAWAGVLAIGIIGATFYSVVTVLVTGRGIMSRREPEHDDRAIVAPFGR